MKKSRLLMRIRPAIVDASVRSTLECGGVSPPSLPLTRQRSLMRRDESRRWSFYIYLRCELRAGNHPGAIAPPLLIQEGSSGRLPSSDEEGRRASGGGGAEQELYKLQRRDESRRAKAASSRRTPRCCARILRWGTCL